MDLNFGNTCNLKCRMCGSWGSTHWHKEDKKLQSKYRITRALVEDVFKDIVWRDK